MSNLVSHKTPVNLSKSYVPQMPSVLPPNNETPLDIIDSSPVKLKNFVRCEYYNYLEKILRQNYNTWCTIRSPNCELNVTELDVKKCAEYLELNAVRSSIVVEVYRKYILRQIAQIRSETSQFVLNSIFADWKTQINTKHDVGCQTEDPSILHLLQNHLPPPPPPPPPPTEEEQSRANLNSLDEKILRFESMLRECETERKMFQAKTPPTPITIPELCSFDVPLSVAETDDDVKELTFNGDNLDAPPSNNKNDEVECELEKLFGGEEDDDDFEKIFGIKVEMPLPATQSLRPDLSESYLIKADTSIDAIIQQPLNDESVTADDDLAAAKRKQLRDSIWPCELHMQRLKFRNIMMEIADKGMRHHEKVRKRLLELFGEDSDDEELCFYSPSIELDEILMGSCKKRIAPWVVSALMVPLKEGRIASRPLFKRAAKKLAEMILRQNQYPDSTEIQLFITDYFKNNPDIISAHDII